MDRAALPLLAALLLGCGLRTTPAPVPLPPPGSARPATLLSSSAAGFYTLHVDNGAWSNLGKVRFAQTREELAALWRDAHIARPVPEVDLGTHVVVQFADHDDGCLEELTAFALDDRGVLRPRLEPFGGACTLPLTTTVYVAALARAALPGRVVLKLEAGGEIDVPAAGAVTLEGPARAPAPRDADPPVSPLDAARATLSLPPEGEVVPRFLDDGTPVWLAHHAGGEVSVLEAATPERQRGSGPEDVKYLTGWDPTTRRFSARWDERGVPVLGRVQASLPRHRAEIASGPACEAAHARAAAQGHAIEAGPAPRCARVGDVAAGSPRRQVAPRPPGPPGHGQQVFHLDQGEDSGIPVEQALREGEGRVVLLDASLVIAGHDPPHVCKVDPRARADDDVRCPPGAPVPEGHGKWECDACIQVLRGPLFARVEGSRLRDLVLTGGGISHHSLPGARLSPLPAEWRGEIGAGVALGLDGGGVHSGGTAFDVGFRRVYRQDRDPTGMAQRVLAGNVAGFDLRAAWTHRAAFGGVATSVALGIAGRLEQHHDWIRIRSVLGLLVPEFGVILDSEAPARLYVGASFPVAFRHQYAYFGLELVPTLRYLPETGTFTGLVTFKGLDRW